MPLNSAKFRVRTLTAAAIAFLLVAPAANSQKVNPFSKFGGKWVGNGEVHLASAPKELIKCNADFVTSDGLSVINLKLAVRCANPGGYKFELQGDLNLAGNEITGTWTEISRGINGKVTAKLKDDQINGVAESTSFQALLDIKNLGDKQHITITSPGSEITNVLIGLNRRGGTPQSPPS